MHSKRSRRRHPAELKDKVLAACDKPGASVAAVAHAHGLNANLVHKWRRCRDAGRLSSATADIRSAKVADLPRPPAPLAAAALAPLAAAGVAVPTDAASVFVPVQLDMSRAATSDIRLELHRGAATVIVTWPAQGSRRVWQLAA